MFIKSLPTRLLLGFLILLLFFSSLQVYSLINLRKTSEEFRIINKVYLQMSLKSHALEINQASLLLMIKNLKSIGGQRRVKKNGLLNKWINLTQNKRRRAYKDLLKLVNNRKSMLRQQDKNFFLTQITPLLQEIGKDIDGLTKAFFKELKKGKISDNKKSRSFFRREQVLRTKIRRLVSICRNKVRSFADRIEENEYEQLQIQLLLLIGVFILSVFVILFSSKPLKYLKKLTEGARKLGQGDLDSRIKVTTGDELGILAAEFNSMAEAIEIRESKIIQNEKLATVGRMSSQIAHEIRNPLTSISFNVELLQDVIEDFEQRSNTDDISEAQDILSGLQKEVDRLTGITEEYLEFARMPQPKLTKTDLNSFLLDFIDFIEGELLLENIDIILELEENLSEVMLDPKLFRHVMINLVKNSREAMEKGGEIKIGTKALSGDLVELKVSDNGKGIKKEDQSNIFNAFYTDKEHGTGLGLSFSKQITESHNGRIEVESEPGKGSTFKIVLPAIKENEIQNTDHFRGNNG
ncbi:MAG: ATP-binding protein [Myxococcota bacterium]